MFDSRQVKGKSQFLVKWKDYEEESNSWEPEENLQHCPEVLKGFLARRDLSLGEGSVRKILSKIPDNNFFENSTAEGDSKPGLFGNI
ncbi:Chromobox protein 5 [Entomophthora muscae]|uniref:Chromobox protein 5 n=1 Tax=Entomophthora muscae TaxID=34485 RepID=A0ACC2UGR0_9FUNG|nr:Chromobox protein 5 [Entomophthora muscae]